MVYGLLTGQIKREREREDRDMLRRIKYRLVANGWEFYILYDASIQVYYLSVCEDPSYNGPARLECEVFSQKRENL
jgi:hypothetical protein